MPSFKAQKLIVPLRNESLDNNRNFNETLKAHSIPPDNGYMIKNFGNQGSTGPKLPHACTFRFPTGTGNTVTKVIDLTFLFFSTK